MLNRDMRARARARVRVYACACVCVCVCVCVCMCVCHTGDETGVKQICSWRGFSRKGVRVGGGGGGGGGVDVV